MQPSGAFRAAAFRSFDQCLSVFCRFNSASSAFISAISTFSFSSHSSRVCAYTFRACFLPSIHVGEYLEDYAEHEPSLNLWRDLLDALETEQRDRATRQARKIRPCPTCGKPLEIMSIADSWHSPGGFDVIAHCRNCLSDYEWLCDMDGSISDMKQYFFG